MPTTTNHLANLPTVGADADEWGTENNTAHQFWDTLTSGAQNTVLGRVAASSGPYTQLTATQLTTIPNAVVGDTGTGGTKGLVPAPAAGDAAARKFLMADGTWVADERKAWGVFTGATGATVAARNLSVSRTSAGLYAVSFGTALASTSYAVVYGLQYSSTDLRCAVAAAGKTATGFSFIVQTSGGVDTDPTQFYLQVLAA